MQANRSSNDDDSDGSSVDLAFASMDMTGVDFEQDANAMDPALLEWESKMAFQKFDWLSTDDKNKDDKEDPWKASKEKAENAEVLRLAKLIFQGKYTELLKKATVAESLFQINQPEATIPSTTASDFLKQQSNDILNKASKEENGDTVFWELEMIGIAALNLFLQSNYTGPTLDEKNKDNFQYLADVNPHPGPLREILHRKQSPPATTTTTNNIATSTPEPEPHASEGDSTQEPPMDEILVRETLPFHHVILTELAVDGEWPCPVCENPYFLMVALVVLETLADSSSNPFSGIHLWYSRVLVAHLRLLQVRVGEAPPTLETKLDRVFDRCIATFDERSSDDKVNTEIATILLERGLADHHLDRPQKGRQYFEQAQARSGLEVEVTGAYGKRTKFQSENKAQMTVRAKSTAVEQSTSTNDENQTKEDTSNLMVEQPEDSILLERIKYDDEKENEIQPLNMLDQSILLALCLDVKNKNPSKEALTSEEMGAFLARVLDHVDDWMIYATALLERSWLEFERSHAKERAILQMQALADQHTNRLTFTQSTKESVENAAPVQERLKHLHTIVYPPRWAMIEEIADRYAGMGIVTSAAELFTEIELWDDVVGKSKFGQLLTEKHCFLNFRISSSYPFLIDCYTRAGKRQKAEQVVRQQLSKNGTPRMWTALGDLTQDITHYERAIEVSNKRYAKAYIALAQHYFEKQDLLKAYENYDEALKLKPLTPHVWFRFGTLSMQLERWDSALKAFSEVVRQEPEEAEAWANVAAIHMHNRNPAEAYPALNESLKQNRNNWRVWVRVKCSEFF